METYKVWRDPAIKKKVVNLTTAGDSNSFLVGDPVYTSVLYIRSGKTGLSPTQVREMNKKTKELQNKQQARKDFSQTE